MITINKQTMNAELVAGDTATFSFVLTINNEGFLAEGDKVIFTLRRNPVSEVLMSKEITDFNNNIITIPITAEETKELRPGIYIYSLDLIREGGSQDNLIPNTKGYASFTVKKGVKDYE